MSSIRENYFSAIKQFNKPNEEIDIRSLLMHINGIQNMSGFFLKLDDELKDEKKFKELLKLYSTGVPMAYLLNEASFCGDTFYVNESVLIPRFETEEVVIFASKLIQKYFKGKDIVLADVCTGSGCLGIEVAKYVNTSKLILSDISAEAIEVAKKNSKALLPNTNVDCYVGDCLEPLTTVLPTIDVLVANPPYIIDKNTVDKSVLDNEPHLALFTDDSLHVYRRILETLSKTKNNIKVIVFELGEEIYKKLMELLFEFVPGANVVVRKDMNGQTRMVGIIL